MFEQYYDEEVTYTPDELGIAIPLEHIDTEEAVTDETISSEESSSTDSDEQSLITASSSISADLSVLDFPEQTAPQNQAAQEPQYYQEIDISHRGRDHWCKLYNSLDFNSINTLLTSFVGHGDTFSKEQKGWYTLTMDVIPECTVNLFAFFFLASFVTFLGSLMLSFFSLVSDVLITVFSNQEVEWKSFSWTSLKEYVVGIAKAIGAHADKSYKLVFFKVNTGTIFLLGGTLAVMILIVVSFFIAYSVFTRSFLPKLEAKLGAERFGQFLNIMQDNA